MDRLPDINRTATPAARPEASDRQPRDNARAARSRAEDKTENKVADPKSRVDAQQRANRSDDKSTDRPGRFEVQDAAPARKPAAQPAPEADAQPAATAAQDVAELVAQQPALRAKAIRAAPPDIAKASSKQDPIAAVPLALPTHVEVIAPTSETPVSEVSALEGAALDVRATPRAVATDAPQQLVEAPVEKPRVEAPTVTREIQPPRDLERAADILRQVRVHLVPRTSEAHIHLEPRELGRVAIHVTVEDGHMKASVRAEKREALDAIQAHLPELRATLRDSGITSQDFQFSLGLENQPRRDPPQSGRQQPNNHVPAIEARTPEHAALLRATAAASGVDLYA